MRGTGNSPGFPKSPRRKGWHLHPQEPKPPRKAWCEKFHSRWTIAGVGEVASVFYTVLLGTLLKSEGFNGREQRNHPATSVVYSDFLGGEFLQQFWRVNVESSCLFVLIIMLSVGLEDLEGIFSMQVALRASWRASWNQKNLVCLICQVIGSESVD